MQIQEQLDYGVHEDPRGTKRTTILTAATTESDVAASVSEPEHVAARAPSQFQTAALARAEPQPEHMDMTLTALTDMMNLEGSESCEASVVTRIYAGKLFDPESLELLENRVITVSETLGLVLDARTFEEAEYEAETSAWKEKEGRGELSKVRTVDLRKLTVLPGFVDAHVHCELLLTVLNFVYSRAASGCMDIVLIAVLWQSSCMTIARPRGKTR